MKITRETIKTELKKLVPIYIMCFIIGAISFAMGMLNYWNNLSDVQYSELDRTTAEISKSIDLYDALLGAKSADDANVLRNTADLLKDNSLLDTESTNVYLYNLDTGEFSGTDESLASLAEERINPPKSKNGIKDSYIYTCFSYDDDTLIYVEMDISYIVNFFKAACIETGIIYFLALILIFFPLMLLVALLAKSDKVKRGVTYALTVLSTLLLALILTIFSIFTLAHNIEDVYSRILTSTNDDVNAVASLTDEQCGDLLTALKGYGLETDEAYTDAENKDQLLNMLLKYDGTYYEDMYTMSVNDNIWDTSLPIEDRITIELIPNYFISGTMDYIIQSIMLTLLSLVLVMEAFNYRKKGTEETAATDPGPTGYRRFFSNDARIKIMLTLKSIADSLTVAVAMKLLKSYVYSANPANGSTIVNLIVIFASAISCLGMLLAPYIYKRCKNSINVFRLAAVICIAGSVCCFLLSENIGFVIGYLVVAAGDLIMGFFTNLYTLELDDAKEGRSLFKNIRKGIKAGALIGFAIGAVLMSLLPYEYMYLISAVALVLLLIMTIGFKRDISTVNIPENTHIKEILKTKNIIPYLILVLIPFGFSAYFFKYKMPLDIAEIGLSATVVSFIYFFQNFTKLMVKKTTLGKKFLKRFKARTLIAVYMGLTAALYVAYAFMHGFIWILIIALLLALINARLGGNFLGYMFDITGNDGGKVFGLRTVYMFGKNCGKTIAPAVTQFFGLLGLPFLLVVCTGIFMVKSRKKIKT